LEATSLVSACFVALVSVFTLLGSLAVIFELITVFFPARQQRIDPVLIGAISTAVATIYPGARLTRIEEE
jgi:hypothetical protein